MGRALKVLLFGYGHAGVAALNALQSAGHEIVGCFTHDTLAPWQPSLAETCRIEGISCRTDAPVPSLVSEYQSASRPDLVLSAGYRQRICLSFLSLPRWGAINAHPAPLPRYRGNRTVQWGLIHQETAWGVTVHMMTHKYNDGGILVSRPVPVRATDNAYDLWTRSMSALRDAIGQSLDHVAQNDVDLTAQDPQHAAFYTIDAPLEGKIDWNQPAERIAAYVRAMDFGCFNDCGGYRHWLPPAQASIGGQTIGIWRARAGGVTSAYPPGTITRCDQEVWVQAARGHLVIEKLRDADGADYDAAAYFARRMHNVGDAFDTRHCWYPPPGHLTQAA